MKTISHREMRNNSSAILRAVEAGESFEITNHGTVVALLVPASEDPFKGMNVQRSTVRGGFSDLQTVRRDITIQEILDDLKGEH